MFLCQLQDFYSVVHPGYPHLVFYQYKLVEILAYKTDFASLSFSKAILTIDCYTDRVIWYRNRT